MDYEGQKGKSINVNYWWNMGDTSTKSRYFINDWYLGQIFSLYTCNYGVNWKQCSRFVFIKDFLPSFVKMAAFWAEMGVAYLEINKLPC
jgi:hypothetical protein